MEKDKSRRYTLGLHVDGSRYGIVDPCVPGDESSVQHCSSEEVDERMDMSEVVGTASREIGFEFVDILVESDNEAALTSLIEMRIMVEAIRGGLRIIVENSVVGRSKSNGIVEFAIQSVQMMIRTIRNDIEEK